MVDLSDDGKRFLTELYHRTGGDGNETVSMFDVGSAAGLDRERSGTVGEELIGWGLVEVRTLSGGIALAETGVAEAQKMTGEGNDPGSESFCLGNEAVLDEQGREAVDRIVSRVKTDAEGYGLGFERLAEMIADLKTIDAQLTSPRPKTALVKEGLRSILANLTANGADRPCNELRRILGE